jgi:hypothetical protein
VQNSPLTARQGRLAPSGPHEGVPDHLRTPLENWIAETYRYLVFRSYAAAAAQARA